MVHRPYMHTVLIKAIMQVHHYSHVLYINTKAIATFKHFDDKLYIGFNHLLNGCCKYKGDIKVRCMINNSVCLSDYMNNTFL